MKEKILMVMVFLVLLAPMCYAAQSDIPAPFDSTSERAMASSAIAFNTKMPAEWQGTFLVTETKNEARKPVTFRVKVTVLEKQWSWYQELLDDNGQPFGWVIAEAFDGQRSLLMQQPADSIVEGRYRVLDKTDPEGPQHPDLLLSHQEVIGLVSGGGTSLFDGTTFSYYAGEQIGGPEGAAYVSLGQVGWTCAFLDKRRGYIATEIWDGTNNVSGKAVTTFSDWKQDEKGRWYPDTMTQQLRMPHSQDIYVTYKVTVQSFSRQVDPAVFDKIANLVE